MSFERNEAKTKKKKEKTVERKNSNYKKFIKKFIFPSLPSKK